VYLFSDFPCGCAKLCCRQTVSDKPYPSAAVECKLSVTLYVMIPFLVDNCRMMVQ